MAEERKVQCSPVVLADTKTGAVTTRPCSTCSAACESEARAKIRHAAIIETAE
jgi:hypothetical protein